MSPKERTLFLTLWVLLILGAALWWFRPAGKKTAYHPAVQVAPELREWLSDAAVVRTAARHFEVALFVSPAYRDRGFPLEFGYELRTAARAVDSGNVPVRLQPGDRTQIQIPNPRGIAPKSILLFLAH